MVEKIRARFVENRGIKFNLLSEEQREEIYSAALEILERTGAKIFDEEALSILKDAGCYVEGTRVRIPRGISRWAVNAAPSRILLYNQKGDQRLVLGGNNVYYGPGPSNTYHLDPYTGERRRPVLKDTENVGRVCDALEHIDFAMDLGTVTGVTDTLADVYAFATLLRNTNKPIVHWGFDIDNYNDIVEMAAAVKGGLEKLQQKPFLALYSEPSSPLLHSQEAIAKAVYAAKKRIPIVYTPCVMSGATTPSTMAGTIALGIAESLVGIVVSQLVREGSPIIMGGVYGIMDMKTTVYSYGSPEFHVLQGGIAEVARHMEMPVFGTAGCTDSHISDGQAGAEAAMSILMAAESGANLVHDCGYTGSGSTGSLQQLVMADEIIAMVKRIVRGIKIDDETLALDVIDKVGPGGHFLGEEHTMKHFKNETFFPTLIDRQRYDAWSSGGSKTFGQRGLEKLHKILENHQVENLPNEVEEQINKILEAAEKREEQKIQEKKKK